MDKRCIGCQWHTPQKMGGQGIICTQHDGKCPEWAVQWALRYSKNGYGKSIKSFTSDEKLVESMRL